VTSVAVVAHSAKRLGGGLGELRSVLAAEGVTEPLWAEVPKSRFAPKRVKEMLKQGADLVFVWGGDGTVQRCIDVLAGSDATMAILPAGTANLFATNLGIPKDLEAAVRIGCGLAPAIMIDDVVYKQMTPAKVNELLSKF
jgi:diacylglycerol kinase family enzyme